MKKALIILMGIIFMTDISAQNYELATRFSPENVRRMISSTKVSPIWFQNSNKFLYHWKSTSGKNLYMVDPERGSKQEVFDMDNLAMRLTEITKDPVDAQHIQMNNLRLEEDRYITFYVKGSQKRFFEENDSSYIAKKKRGTSQNFYFRYDIGSRKLEDVTLEKQDKLDTYPKYMAVSPDGMRGIYVKNHDLYMMDMENMKKLVADPKDSTVVEIRLTQDGSNDFCWGSNNYTGNTVTDSTLRHSPSQLVWSPDSRKFATIRWDMSKVKDLWIIHSLSNPRPTLQTYKYQMPAEPGYEGHMYVFDVASKERKEIKVDMYKEQDLSFEYASIAKKEKSKEQYKEGVVDLWKGDEKGFYMIRHSRDQKKMDVCYVPADGDSAMTVIHEELNTYVENRPVKLIKGGTQIIQWSERNGWANLYLYKSDGTLIRNLTDGAYHVDRAYAVNEKGNYVIFSACGVNPDENPYYMHTYKVSLSGGPIVQMDMADMNVSATVSEDAKFFIANYSRVDCTPGSALYNAQTGNKVMDLETADFSELIAAGYKFPERFKVKAADGITDLYGEMYKPYDFDPNKVYPIIDYVYPGPQVEANSIIWRAGNNRTDRLAQMGFIVITVGNRGGHPNRSKWYHNFGYGNLRDYGLADQKYAIEQLAARNKFIDLNRVGIQGHSGGGFMSTAAILTYPDFFKVAVSAAGNHDNRIYNRWWSEQHNGYDEKSTKEYKVGINQELVKNLKGHLMLVHGDADDNVHPANTIRIVDALIQNNKRFDMLILPGQNHGFETMDGYFFWRMADYFSEWLLGNSKRNEVDIPKK